MSRSLFSYASRSSPGGLNEFLALLNDVFDAMKVDETFVNATALRSADGPDTIVLSKPGLTVTTSCRSS